MQEVRNNSVSSRFAHILNQIKILTYKHLLCASFETYQIPFCHFLFYCVLCQMEVQKTPNSNTYRVEAE